MDATRQVIRRMLTEARRYWYSNLIQNAKVLSYGELPPQHQKALEAVGRDMEGGVHPIRKEKGHWIIGDIPVREIISLIMNQHIDISQGWESWEAYHDWYVSEEPEAEARLPYEGAGERYPVLLSPDDEEIIDDGWHRFHRYVDVGLDAIPVMADA